MLARAASSYYSGFCTALTIEWKGTGTARAPAVPGIVAASRAARYDLARNAEDVEWKTGLPSFRDGRCGTTGHVWNFGRTDYCRPPALPCLQFDFNSPMNRNLS